MTTNFLIIRGRIRTTRSKGNRKRQLKSNGTNKMGHTCPSGMIARKSHGGSVQVEFYKTHFGHETELRRIPLHISKREQIAGTIPCDIFSGDDGRQFFYEFASTLFQRFLILKC